METIRIQVLTLRIGEPSNAVQEPHQRHCLQAVRLLVVYCSLMYQSQPGMVVHVTMNVHSEKNVNSMRRGQLGFVPEVKADSRR